MNAFFLKAWIYARESMWIVPTAMTIIAIALAFGLVEFDHAHTGKELSYNWFVYGGNPVGARSILSTIASSMITIAGVAFSLNLVTLTLASSQYGPRLLRNFIKDLGNQLVLGTFIATFVYSLIVLLSIRTSDDQGFVPQTAVAFAFVLALASLGVLIYFIHHNSSSIQADNIIRSAYNDLLKTIDGYADKDVKKKSDRSVEQEVEDLKQHNYHVSPLCASSSGYIQAIDNSSLQKVCEENDIVVKLDHQVGDFVVADQQVGNVYSKQECTDDIPAQVQQSLIIGMQRTPTQDIEFPINQITEIAIRALSPGVNDPNTAITCIHWLGSAMSRLVALPLPDNLYYDEDDKLRIIQKFHDFGELLYFCFNDIRFHATGNANVSHHLLSTLRKVAGQATAAQQLDKILEMAQLILRVNEQAITETTDKNSLKREFVILEQVVNTRQLK